MNFILEVVFTTVIGFSVSVISHECGHFPNDCEDGDGSGGSRGHRGVTRGGTNKSSGGHQITCNEFNVTALWKRSVFVGDEYEVKLIDSTCNRFHKNKTSIWITADFGTCGSSIIEHRSTIIQKNSATLIVRNTTKSLIAREHVYKYNLQCVFPRRNNASSHSGYEVSQKVKKIVNLTSVSAFDITIDIYTSSSFLLKAAHPITVSTNQPIYIGIKKVQENEKFTMIVEQCFATPTASTNGASYMFFHNKCSLDSSFNIINTRDNKFQFVITAFKFIKNSKAIYIHCRVFICKKNSVSSQCNQSCAYRRRRLVNKDRASWHSSFDVFENAEIQEIQNITTNQIIIISKASCNDTYCSNHSKCFNLYPAVCRCDTGYIFSSKQYKCVNERVVNIKGLHLNVVWAHTYTDITSIDFIRLANETEMKLANAFHELQLSHIEGVKVIRAKYEDNNVVLDVSLIHQQNSTVDNIYESLIKPFANRNLRVISMFRKMNVVTKRIPVIDNYVVTPTLKQAITKAVGEITMTIPIFSKTMVRTTTTMFISTTQVAKTIPIFTKSKAATKAKSKATTTLLENHSILQETNNVAVIPIVAGNSTNIAEGDDTEVYSKEDTILLCTILGVVFVFGLVMITLVCHYKWYIYYHLLSC